MAQSTPRATRSLLQRADHWLEGVRMSDHTVKTFWFYALTGTLMLIVIAFWFTFERATLPAVNAPPGNAPQLAVHIPAAPSTTAVLAAGTRTITADVGGRFSRGIALLKSFFSGPSNHIVINSQGRNFIPAHLEDVTPGTLPNN